MTVGPDGFNKS